MEAGRALIPPVPLANIQRVELPTAGRFSFCPSPRRVQAKPREEPPVRIAEDVPAAGATEKESSKVQVLQDTTDPNYEPTLEDIHEYAVWLGMNIQTEHHLLWIARAGLKAPCQEPWKPCKTEEGDIFYFNFATGESIWDHPADVYYKTLYQKQKAQSSSGAGVVPALKLPQPATSAPSSLFLSPRKLTSRVSARVKKDTEAQTAAADVIAPKEDYGKIEILEYQSNYEPTDDEVMEYAVWLGMNLEDDKDLIWIATAGLKEPCPAPWKPCQTEAGAIFFFNFSTGESIWDHPRDQHFRDLLNEEKAKKALVAVDG